MAYSEAQKRATLKFREKTYDRMEIIVPKGKKEEYKLQAQKHEMSLNAYIISLIEKDIRTE